MTAPETIEREKDALLIHEISERHGTAACCLYRHFDREDHLLYVGVSLSAINRLAQHRDASHWFAEIAHVKIESFKDRKEALAAERRAIIEENPRHNLRRPSVKEVKAAAELRSDESRADLVQRLVQFNPMYSLGGAAMVLETSTGILKKLLDAGEIGFIQMGSKKRITGWQLIEYIEAKTAERKL